MNYSHGMNRLDDDFNKESSKTDSAGRNSGENTVNHYQLTFNNYL
jgi:hypothetical protein